LEYHFEREWEREAYNMYKSGFWRTETVPETFGFRCTETVPESKGFGNSFGSIYSVPETLGFRNVIEAPETADFLE
jgi:hypothetical protein